MVTRTFFVSMHEQPVFKKRGLFKGERYPVAEEISRKGMYLPSSSGLEKGEIKFVANTLKEVIK
ncbi:MAG: DegT/DnrJ/EryC1/StrS aminotransferase family protein [Thermoplasmatales archaeon]|nr:DegT/DnrJ/EryC1/StrS aminotransferase family protein [Thermoplasmatales archaeon]